MECWRTIVQEVISKGIPLISARLFLSLSHLCCRAHDVVAQTPVREVEVLKRGRLPKENRYRHASHGQRHPNELLPGGAPFLAQRVCVSHDFHLLVSRAGAARGTERVTCWTYTRSSLYFMIYTRQGRYIPNLFDPAHVAGRTPYNRYDQSST